MKQPIYNAPKGVSTTKTISFPTPAWAETRLLHEMKFYNHLNSLKGFANVKGMLINVLLKPWYYVL